MAVCWRILALDFQDRIICEIDDYQSFWYEKRQNQVGNCQIVLSASSPNLATLAGENIRLAFQLIYQDALKANIFVDDWGGELIGDGLVMSEDGKPTDKFSFSGADWNYWLTGRRILPPPGLAYLDLDNAFADGAVKTAIRTSITNTGVPSRNIPGLTCSPDASQGAAVKYSARYESLYDVVTTLAGQGNIKFAIVRDGRITQNAFRFYTYYPYLGLDRTSGNQSGNAPVVFSASLQTLGTLSYQRDRTSMANVAYVGGDGEAELREVDEFADLTSLAQYRRRETFVDARSATTTAKRQAEAFRVFNTQAVPTEQLQLSLPLTGDIIYGRDWQLGDLVTVYIPELDRTINAEVTAVRVEQVSGASARVVPTIGQYRTFMERLQQQARIIRLFESR
jgi:hypothetical protein